MSRKKAAAGVHPRRQSARRGHQPPPAPPDDVTVRLSFDEAALVVIGATMAKGFAGRQGGGMDQLLGEAAGDIIGKLYRASPALKRETKGLEKGIRESIAREMDADAGAFGPDPDADDDLDAHDGEGPVLRGQDWLGPIAEAMEASQEVTLEIGRGRGRRRRRLQPLGAGHIGDVAVVIGWSPDTTDFTAVRLDEVDALEETSTSFDARDGDLAEACLRRFANQPAR